LDQCTGATIMCLAGVVKKNPRSSVATFDTDTELVGIDNPTAYDQSSLSPPPSRPETHPTPPNGQVAHPSQRHDLTHRGRGGPYPSPRRGTGRSTTTDELHPPHSTTVRIFHTTTRVSYRRGDPKSSPRMARMEPCEIHRRKTPEPLPTHCSSPIHTKLDDHDPDPKLTRH